MKKTTVVKNFCMLGTARRLRRDMTPQERKLWYEYLRTYPVKFYKQRIIESFIVDFYCHEIGLVIELDGSQHGIDDSVEYDVERTKFLEALGLTAVRYWNHDVLSRADVVLEDLLNVCCELRNTSP